MPTRGIYSDVTLPYLTYHQWCALPAQRALVNHPPYRLPRYMLLDLPRDVIHSVVACFNFVFTPFALKQQLGIPPPPLLATCVRLMMMSRIKNMFSFTARTLRWFLFAGSTPFYFQDGCVCFLTLENNTPFFVHATYLNFWTEAESYFLTESLFLQRL